MLETFACNRNNISFILVIKLFIKVECQKCFNKITSWGRNFVTFP